MFENLLPFGYSIQINVLAFFLGSTRLFAFIQTVPFMGNNVIAPVRFAIVLALYFVLHPLMLPTVPDLFPLSGAAMLTIFGLLVKEVFLGFILGYIAGQLFWVVQSAGFFIDNQRGAGQAQTTDALSGEETSPTGSFFFQSVTYVFYSSGAFLAMLSVLYSTYEIWPVGQWLPYEFFTKEGAALFFGELVARLALNMVLLAAPVVLACLFTDITLGIINRFASQLNVYVLAMGVKSGIASFLLLLYLSVLVANSTEQFKIFNLDVSLLKVFF